MVDATAPGAMTATVGLGSGEVAVSLTAQPAGPERRCRRRDVHYPGEGLLRAREHSIAWPGHVTVFDGATSHSFVVRDLLRRPPTRRVARQACARRCRVWSSWCAPCGAVGPERRAVDPRRRWSTRSPLRTTDACGNRGSGCRLEGGFWCASRKRRRLMAGLYLEDFDGMVVRHPTPAASPRVTI